MFALVEIGHAKLSSIYPLQYCLSKLNEVFLSTSESIAQLDSLLLFLRTTSKSISNKSIPVWQLVPTNSLGQVHE